MAEERDEILFADEADVRDVQAPVAGDAPAPEAAAPVAPAEPEPPRPLRNQDVLDMIGTLHARLSDLEGAVRACEADLPGFAAKLDRIDDKIYLVETEVAKVAAGGAAPAAPAQPPVEGDADGDGMKILTPEAKEAIGEFAGDLKAVAKTGAETLADLNEAFSDIASPFKAFTKSGRRR